MTKHLNRITCSWQIRLAALWLVQLGLQPVLADDTDPLVIPEVPSGMLFTTGNSTDTPQGYPASVDSRVLDVVSLESPAPTAPEPPMQEVVAAPVAVQEFIEFPEEHVPLHWHLLEATPTLLSKPVEPLGKVVEKVVHAEHDHTHTDLNEHAIGLQPIAERPKLIWEWNEPFLAPAVLEQGIEIPTGTIWRPAFWVFGEYRTAIQYYDNQGPADPIVEWANRLDLFGQLNLSGTERLLIGLRPLDEEELTARDFSAYDFRNGDSIDGWNAEFQTLFFEGDFGELFPWLDPYDSKWLDYGYSVGRMPLLAQQGLLIAEDMIDAVTVTRNTVNGWGVLNLRMTGVYAWDRVTRNSAFGPPNTLDRDSSMVALLTETDCYHSTVNADLAFVFSDDNNNFGDLLAFGLSDIRRIHGFENSYNLSTHLLASFPTSGATNFAGQGELLFSQLSWTPHRTEDLVYLNSFLAIDQFTSPSRGPLDGGPLGLTGLMFTAPGVGRAGPPIGVQTNDSFGGSLGYQLFFNHTRQQLIWEIGGQKEYEGTSRGAIGTVARYQRALGQHYIFAVDTFVAKRETQSTSQGARFEVLVRF